MILLWAGALMVAALAHLLGYLEHTAAANFAKNKTDALKACQDQTFYPL